MASDELLGGIDIRDALERIVWTLAQALGGVAAAWVTRTTGLELPALSEVATQGIAFVLGTLIAVVITLFVRLRARFLPEPGDGLPGLPTGSAHAGHWQPVEDQGEGDPLTVDELAQAEAGIDFEDEGEGAV